MIKVLVFDLDDTLLDTTGLLIPIAKTPAFHERIRKPLPLLEGAQKNLQTLKTKYRLALLTMGHVESQQAKVQSLGIAHFFERFYFADPQKKETKQDKFQEMLSDFKISGSEFMSIGNRRSTDIRDAKKVGGWTCLFKYGEHQDEQPSQPEDVPDFEVLSHQDLVRVCQL